MANEPLITNPAMSGINPTSANKKNITPIPRFDTIASPQEVLQYGCATLDRLKRTDLFEDDDRHNEISGH